MWTDYAIGIATLFAILAAWLAVQHAWRRTFTQPHDDPDPLAGRLGCRGSCTTQPCARRCAEPPHAPEEHHA